MHKISVCVPTYNRPDTLRQLINSFLRQDYKNKELIISDDTPNDSIKKVVKEYNNKSIKYFHNTTSLRFAKNLKASLNRATGDYLVTLGDDDVLLNTHALSNYVEIFKKNPTVGFVYSNIIQFTDPMQIQYKISYTQENKLFLKGEDSMNNVWMKSLFIGGLGLRNGKNILKFFPEEKVLYPQVEFVGNIVNTSDAYLSKEYNIGFRSHDEQIIFHALKNKKIRQEGDHTTVEFFSIFNRLNKKYHLGMSSDFLAKELINLQFVMMFKEKHNLGTEALTYNYKKFTELSTVVKNSKKLKLGYQMAKYMPDTFVLALRQATFTFFSLINGKEFAHYKKQLELITKDISS